MRQSGHLSRCRLISPSTGEDRRPSKYQQIKWIVSLQLMPSGPLRRPKRQSNRVSTVHLPLQRPHATNRAANPYGINALQIQCPLPCVRRDDFLLKKLHQRRLKCAEFRRKSWGLALRNDSHVSQRRNAIWQGRVRAEQSCQPSATETGPDDAE